MQACSLWRDKVSTYVYINAKVLHMYAHVSAPSQTTQVKPGLQTFPRHPTLCSRGPGRFSPRTRPRMLTRVGHGCRGSGAGGVRVFLLCPPHPHPRQQLKRPFSLCRIWAWFCTWKPGGIKSGRGRLRSLAHKRFVQLLWTSAGAACTELRAAPGPGA